MMTKNTIDKATINIFGEIGSNRIQYLKDLENKLPAYIYKFTSIEEYEQTLSTNFGEILKHIFPKS